MTNPVFYFEIPVTDLDRAVAFCESVFGFSFDRQSIDGNDMAFFPRNDQSPGASGALAKGETYRPSHAGCVVYFDVADIEAVLQRSAAAGAKLLYEKTNVGEGGVVAEIEDSEGNRIALNEFPS